MEQVVLEVAVHLIIIVLVQELLDKEIMEVLVVLMLAVVVEVLVLLVVMELRRH